MLTAREQSNQGDNARRYAVVGLVSLALVLSGCGLRESNFSQYPGFDRWYAANPPNSELPRADERALLQRYRPRLFLAPGAARPIRFYEDYVANGTLTDKSGQTISRQVDAPLLNKYRDDPTVVFTYEPRRAAARISPSAQAIARIDRETLPAGDGYPARELTFLTYHFVFAHSGIAAGIRPWQKFLVGLLADPQDWHQLDHYTAVSIVLDSVTHRPLAALVQQHNYLRTWLFDKAPGPGRLVLEPDRRVRLVAAEGSNELYVHRTGRQFRRAVPMLDADNINWLIFGKERPWVSADDITEPGQEVNYAIKPLPASDAFFVFKGWLGERRRTPGRDGPPGADYNTIPSLKSRVRQLAMFWWYENDERYVQMFRSLGQARNIDSAMLSPFVDRLSRALRRLTP